VKKQQITTLRLSVLASAVSVALAGSMTAAAQQPVEEVVVTGSRIVRRDFEAPSPIVTLDAARFEETASVGIESVMNQLPQFVPAVSQFDAGNTFAGSQRTPGAATLSLRGLGANRNLVLLDGRRAMPINASMAVSINTIPSAAIQRIETITGGASSVYGADAVAGVVNFITRKDFEGLDFDMQTGETVLGDGRESRFSGVFGSNLANGKGNVLLGFERSSRGEILKVDRDFYRQGYEDPYSNTGGSFWSAAGFTADALNRPSQAAINSLFGVSPITGKVVGNTGTFYMNPDATLYKTAREGTYRYNGGFEQTVSAVGTHDVPWRKLNAVTGALQENLPNTLAQIPLERYSLFGQAHLDISDNITAFAQVMYSENSTRATGSDPPMLGGWRTAIPHGNGIYGPSVLPNGNTDLSYQAGGSHGLNCPAVGGCTKSQVWPTPPELTLLLDSRPNPEADFDVVQSVVWAGARRSYIDTSSHQIVGGLDGKFPIKDWTWELYASTGSTTTVNTYGGATSLARWRFVQQQPNYGKGLFYTGNPYGGGFGAGTITCTSGIDSVYGVNGWTEGYIPSEDCQKAVTMEPQAIGVMTQNIVEYNMQGGLAEMKRGDLRFAFGLSSRVNKYQYRPDPTNTPESVLDQPGAFFPVGEAIGKTEVKEIYGELIVPLLADKPAVKSMSLELGYRSTDNNPSNDDDTYKALLDWTILDRVRFRGGRQIANRAPNIGELFQASEQFAPFTAVQGDPCSPLDPAQLPYTANPTINPTRAAKVQALCSQLMGVQGAATFYGDPSSWPDTLVSARISNLIGNPNLHSEQAETTTAGFVIDVAQGSTLTIDYWRIRIHDMIAEEVGDILYQQCLDETTNPAYDPNYPACQRLVRNPSTGQNATISTSYTNQQQVDLAGWDLQYNWGRDVGPGRLNLSEVATIAAHTKTRTAPNAAWFDYKGSSGPSNIRSVNPFSFDYRLLTTVNYSVGKWNSSLRWRYLPSIESESAVRTLVSPDVPTSPYNIFDGSARLMLSSNTELRFGIDNLFDVDPEITFAQDPGYSNTGKTTENFYDFLGRRWYVGFKVNF
jgi:outer membrane receptor protein involved in Fe transport